MNKCMALLHGGSLILQECVDFAMCLGEIQNFQVELNQTLLNIQSRGNCSFDPNATDGVIIHRAFDGTFLSTKSLDDEYRKILKFLNEYPDDIFDPSVIQNEQKLLNAILSCIVWKEYGEVSSNLLEKINSDLFFVYRGSNTTIGLTNIYDLIRSFKNITDEKIHNLNYDLWICMLTDKIDLDDESILRFSFIDGSILWIVYKVPYCILEGEKRKSENSIQFAIGWEIKL